MCSNGYDRLAVPLRDSDIMATNTDDDCFTFAVKASFYYIFKSKLIVVTFINGLLFSTNINKHIQSHVHTTTENDE